MLKLTPPTQEGKWISCGSWTQDHGHRYEEGKQQLKVKAEILGVLAHSFRELTVTERKKTTIPHERTQQTSEEQATPVKGMGVGEGADVGVCPGALGLTFYVLLL